MVRAVIITSSRPLIPLALLPSDPRGNVRVALACVEINQCVGCTRQFFTKSFLGDDAAVLARSSGEASSTTTLSSKRRVDGVEDDATIQHERVLKF